METHLPETDGIPAALAVYVGKGSRSIGSERVRDEQRHLSDRRTRRRTIWQWYNAVPHISTSSVYCKFDAGAFDVRVDLRLQFVRAIASSAYRLPNLARRTYVQVSWAAHISVVSMFPECAVLITDTLANPPSAQS